MTFADAFKKYGNDKPKLDDDPRNDRFGKGKRVQTFFDEAEYIGGICATGCSEYTRKAFDALTEYIKKSQIGGSGLIYAKVSSDGTVKSSVINFIQLKIYRNQHHLEGRYCLLPMDQETLRAYDVHQQFEARTVVDLELVRLCTERAAASDRQRGVLKLAVNGHAFEGDPVAFRLLDIEFHQAINTGAGDPLLAARFTRPSRPRP